MNVTETALLTLKFHKTIRKKINKTKTFHLEYWLTLQYLSQSQSGIFLLSDLQRWESLSKLRLTNKLNFQEGEALRAPCEDSNITEIVAASTKYWRKKKYTTKCSAKTCSFIFSSKWNQSLGEQNCSVSILPHERLRGTSMPPRSHPTGRKQSVFLPSAWTSARASRSPTAALWLCKSLVDVPDLGEQRRELLVLEAEGENLFRVDAA